MVARYSLRIVASGNDEVRMNSGAVVCGVPVGSLLFAACAATTGTMPVTMVSMVALSTFPRMVISADSPGERKMLGFPMAGLVMFATGSLETLGLETFGFDTLGFETLGLETFGLDIFGV